MSNKLIDALGIAKLAGRTHSSFTYGLQRQHPTFPRKVAGGTGKGIGLWSELAVKAWLADWNDQGRQRAKIISRLDNTMALSWLATGQQGQHAIR